jgi:hypothetical protein
MRVRADSFNALAEFLGRPDRLDSPPPAEGYWLTPADTERLLHDLAARRPVYANAMTTVRTAAVAALVADTGRSVPDLAGLTVGALHLDGEARVDLPDGPCPIGHATVQILHRWLNIRAAIIAELEGTDQARARPGRPPVGQAGPGARGGPDPARRPPHAREPGPRRATAAGRLPRGASGGTRRSRG